LRAFLMLMPEAPVNLNDLIQPREDKIRPSWKSMNVKPVAETHPVHESPNSHFGSRILASDAAHVLTTRLRGNPVHLDHCRSVPSFFVMASA
jgi:hypothetical protein